MTLKLPLLLEITEAILVNSEIISCIGKTSHKKNVYPHSILDTSEVTFTCLWLKQATFQVRGLKTSLCIMEYETTAQTEELKLF